MEYFTDRMRAYKQSFLNLFAPLHVFVKSLVKSLAG